MRIHEYLLSWNIERRYFRRRAMQVASHRRNIHYTYDRSFPCAIQNITDRSLMLLSMASVMMGGGGCTSGFPPLNRILMLLHSSMVSSVRHKKFARLNNEKERRRYCLQVTARQPCRECFSPFSQWLARTSSALQRRQTGAAFKRARQMDNIPLRVCFDQRFRTGSGLRDMTSTRP